MNTVWKAIAACAMALAMVHAHAEFVSIAGNKVNVRQAPHTKAEVAWELTEGYPVEVVKKQGQWLKIKDFEAQLGWVHQPLTQKKPHHIVKKKTAVMRSGPGAQFGKVDTMHQYDLLQTIEKKKGWIKVRSGKGHTGWLPQNALWGW